MDKNKKQNTNRKRKGRERKVINGGKSYERQKHI